MHWSHDTSNQDKIRTKIPPPLRKVELGWKSGNMTPKLLPPQWIYCPLNFKPHINSLPKKLRASIDQSLSTLPLRAYYRLNKSSLYFLGLPVSSLNSFCDETRSYPLGTVLCASDRSLKSVVPLLPQLEKCFIFLELDSNAFLHLSFSIIKEL